MPVYPRVKKTEQIRSLFQRVATTNHYEVFFSGFGRLQGLRTHMTNRQPRLTNYFIGRDLGLLCNSAELPATSFATSQIEGNRMGVIEKMAHTRIFTDTTMTFYVDSDYRSLEFFELWHDFIASGSDDDPGNARHNINYYHRMRYPKDYKVDTIRIQKFNKDHFRNVEYTFLNCFPINVASMPVSYAEAQVLEVQVTFAYDRYYFGSITSLNRKSENITHPRIQLPSVLGNENKVDEEKTIYKLDGLERTGYTLTQEEFDRERAKRFVPDNSLGDFPADSYISDIA